MAHEKDKKRKKNVIEGVLRISSSFVGYVINPIDKSEIEIPNKLLRGALNGDVVCITITGAKKDGQYCGEVTKILARKRDHFVGVLRRVGSSYVVTPDDSKMYRDIIVPKKNSGGAGPGKKVLVHVIKWKGNYDEVIGRIEKVLGKPGVHETEMVSILYDKDFSPEFPPQMEKEAKDARHFLHNADIQARRDFRNVTTFTIDPQNAKDFDDALSIKEIKPGLYEVGIHIADVTYFVRPDTKLDKEAAKRATSIYLVDRTIPMLPEVLSNDLCSLNPNEEKLSYSAVFQIDDGGHVGKEWFGRSRIKSDKRFTYEEAQKVLDTGRGPFYKELSVLNKLAYKLRAKKIKGGAISFSDTELEFTLDETMKPIAIIKKERLDTHKLIEDFMLLANKKVAEFVDKLEKRSNIKKHFVYRVHGDPNEEKLARVVDILKRLGYKVGLKNKITSHDINAILAIVEGTAEKELIHTATIQSMAKAEYTTKNIGHFGLSFPFYTHFTSPIRRYPDIMVHRLLDKYLHNKKVSQEEVERYEELAIYSSARERVAEEAERESKKYKQAEYMKDRIGDKYRGIISGVTRFGIFVQEENTRAEGLVALRDMNDDYYSYDEKHLELIGEKTKKKYRLGDKVGIQVKKADVKKKQIDYLLI